MARPKPSAPRAQTNRPKSAGPAADLLYVHGIGEHPSSDALKLEWDLALFGRDMGPRSRMVYWADIVHPPHGGRPAAARAIASAAKGVDVDALLRGVSVDPDRRGARELAAALLNRVGLVDRAADGPRKRVLPLPASWRRPLARRFLEALVGDAAAYLFNPAQRAQIQQRFAAALAGSTAPLTIIAHSLGSVIAYEGVAALGSRPRREVQLITLGSPLGIDEVQDFLLPPGQAVPAMVTQWHNFSDPLDPVSLDAGLSNDFVPNGFIRDQRIVNTRSRSLLELDPHSAVGYLAHSSVRRVVHELLRLDAMARFVLARDVAELLGTEPQQRHPVLIEVLEPGYPALDESPELTREREHRAAGQANAAGRLGLAAVAKVGSAATRTSAPRATTRKTQAAPPPLQLAERVTQVAAQIETLVSDQAAARIDPLQRFVAAHLTAAELCAVAAAHQELRVYAVWRSARKAKLTGRSVQTLKADAALASFGAAGQGITWAVLDTGARADHPHFMDGKTRLIEAVWDCTQPGKPVPISKPLDPDGHGTHVAGIISGKDTAGPHRGVAPRASLVVYKVLDDQGEGEDAWIIKALDHIAQRNANSGVTQQVHGVNLSLGGPFDATVYGCGFSPVCAELRRQWREGVLVVVACGNEGQLQVQTASGEVDLNTAISIGDPANLEDCIAVGSVHADKPHLYGVSSFSSRGPTADGRPKPDVVAPGERISSCNANFHAGRGDLYRVESGTSMAAPHVSGLLAAFLSVRREFIGRPDEVKRLLLDACGDLGRDRYHQGRGLPNLMQMLLAV